MKSILEEFAYGNVSPEPRFFKQNSRFGRAVKTLSECEDKLTAVLNEEEREIFRKFSEAQSEINLLSGIDRFIYGYRLGVLMTAEVYAGKDDLLVGGEDC